MDAGYRIGIVISIHIGFLGNIFYPKDGVVPGLLVRQEPQAVIRKCAASFADPATIA